MLDLDGKQYDMKTLKQYIYSLCFFKILQTQKIDADFARNYILNPDYQMTVEEETITVDYLLEMQPHLNRQMLNYIYKKYHPDAPMFDKIASLNQ